MNIKIHVYKIVKKALIENLKEQIVSFTLKKLKTL